MIESPPSISSAQPKNGTMTMRRVVSTLGRLRLLGRAPVSVIGSPRRSPRRTRSTPSVATTRGTHQVADLGAGAGEVRRAVDLGALVGRAAGDLAVLDGLDEHLDLLAEPLLGALRVELLDQRGDVLGAGADLVLVELAVVRRRLGAVLVGVAEDAGDVHAGRDQEVAEGLRGPPRSRRGSRRSRWSARRPVGASARTWSSRPRKLSGSPKRRIRRSTVALACWKDRSK